MGGYLISYIRRAKEGQGMSSFVSECVTDSQIIEIINLSCRNKGFDYILENTSNQGEHFNSRTSSPDNEFPPVNVLE